jgi:hypothetical protein
MENNEPLLEKNDALIVDRTSLICIHVGKDPKHVFKYQMFNEGLIRSYKHAEIYSMLLSGAFIIKE